jgi:hypothetical protein
VVLPVAIGDAVSAPLATLHWIDYPYLERDDVLAALEFAAAAVQERELPLAQPAQAPCGSWLTRTSRPGSRPR